MKDKDTEHGVQGERPPNCDCHPPLTAMGPGEFVTFWTSVSSAIKWK